MAKDQGHPEAPGGICRNPELNEGNTTIINDIVMSLRLGMVEIKVMVGSQRGVTRAAWVIVFYSCSSIRMSDFTVFRYSLNGG